jgi:hypothetical protein
MLITLFMKLERHKEPVASTHQGMNDSSNFIAIYNTLSLIND